jgi:hypothetical protein
MTGKPEVIGACGSLTWSLVSQLALLGFSISIFLWQQNRGRATVGLRDDPDARPVPEPIAGQDSPSAFQTEFVLANIVLVQFAAVSCQMTL